MAVFEPLYADRYDQLYAQKDYSAECDLIESALARHASVRPHTLLDVGCGTGGHALELARRGFQLTGVDLSGAMLEQARQKSARLATGRPTWLRGDARDFDTGARHDAAIMMFAVVGYLTDNDSVLQGLRNIRRHLDAGAVFICDFWYGPSVLAQRPSDRVRVLNAGDTRVIRSATTTLDTTHHTADVTFQLWSLNGDKVVGETKETHRTRYFFPQEFALFLSQSGFALQGFSAFPSLDAALNDQTWNALAIAKAV
jgi:SAM-dependent methyltransferase